MKSLLDAACEYTLAPAPAAYAVGDRVEILSAARHHDGRPLSDDFKYKFGVITSACRIDPWDFHVEYEGANGGGAFFFADQLRPAPAEPPAADVAPAMPVCPPDIARSIDVATQQIGRALSQPVRVGDWRVGDIGIGLDKLFTVVAMTAKSLTVVWSDGERIKYKFATDWQTDYKRRICHISDIPALIAERDALIEQNSMVVATARDALDEADRRKHWQRQARTQLNVIDYLLDRWFNNVDECRIVELREETTAVRKSMEALLAAAKECE